MTKCSDLGDMNKYVFFPFVGGIVTIILGIIMEQIDSIFETHPLIRGFNSGFGMSFSIIPFLITKYRSNNPIKESESESSTKISIYKSKLQKDEKNTLKGKYPLLLICAILDFLQKELSFTIKHDSENNVWIFDLIFFAFFSWFILNEKLYRHQYISLSIIVVLLISCIFLFDYTTIKEKPFDFFLVLYIEFVYSINHVLNKYIMDTKFCTPYEVSFYEGIFCLIINIILLSIFSNVEIDKDSGALKIFKHKNCNGKMFIDNFNYYMDNFNIRAFFQFLLQAINKISFNLFSLFTIKHFTPSHVIIILFFTEIEYFILTIRKGGGVLAVFIFIILFFAILVFTEFIELNFLDISKNTKKNIRMRATRFENSEFSSFDEKAIEVEEGMLIELPNQPEDESTNKEQ